MKMIDDGFSGRCRHIDCSLHTDASSVIRPLAPGWDRRHAAVPTGAAGIAEFDRHYRYSQTGDGESANGRDERVTVTTWPAFAAGDVAGSGDQRLGGARLQSATGCGGIRSDRQSSASGRTAIIELLGATLVPVRSNRSAVTGRPKDVVIRLQGGGTLTLGRLLRIYAAATSDQQQQGTGINGNLALINSGLIDAPENKGPVPDEQQFAINTGMEPPTLVIGTRWSITPTSRSAAHSTQINTTIHAVP